MRKKSAQKEALILQKKVNRACGDNIKWTQPTISPAAKGLNPDTEKLEIESLSQALKYYSQFCSQVVIQKKHMGSYCLIYLNKDHSKTRFVTKGSQVIKNPEMNQILREKSKELHDIVFGKKGSIYKEGTEVLLVEAELMPWSFLGKGLIEDIYSVHSYLHEENLKFLSNSPLIEKVRKISLTKPWEKENLKPHESRQYKALQNLSESLYDLPEYRESINIFNRQLELFGSQEEPYFEYFNIIGRYYDAELTKFDLCPPNTLANFVSKRGNSIVLSVGDTKNAYKFFNKMQEEEAEGVVVKPYGNFVLGFAHALKVRTENYLQLIYGVDFQKNYETYYEARDISSKIRHSIEDYELAIQALTTPNTKNRYRIIMTKYFTGEEFAKTFDSKL